MDRPGKEIPKEYREVATELVDNQGWGYNDGRGRGGYPALYPPDKAHRPVAVPMTPSKNKRSFPNWIGQIRRAGGIWPPPRRK